MKRLVQSSPLADDGKEVQIEGKADWENIEEIFNIISLFKNGKQQTRS